MANQSSLLWEGYFKSEKDLYYNKDKFISGGTNICFITGQSGSGKSTMASAMTGKGKVEHVDMDLVVMNRNKYSIEDFAKNIPMAGAFFKGPGNQFYVDPSEKKKKLNYDAENSKITKAFVSYAITYAKQHKNQKFVVEGTWIFRYIEPSILKDCAVCVKGTSATTSLYRAGKRDKAMAASVASAPRWYGRENQLQKFRDYFAKLMGASNNNSKNESYIDYDMSNKVASSIATALNDIGREKNAYQIESSNIIVFSAKPIIERIGDDTIREAMYEAHRRKCIFSLNEALDKFFKSSGYNGYDCVIESCSDINNGTWMVRFNLYEDTDNKINGVPVNEAMISLLYENALIRLESMSSGSFVEAAVKDMRNVRRYQKAIEDFLEYADDNVIVETFDSGHIMYEGAEIEDNLKKAHNNIATLEEMYTETYGGKDTHQSFSDECVLDEDFVWFADTKMYTNLSPQNFYNTLDIYKRLYLSMIDYIKNNTKIADGVYYPGWDSHDWRQSPEEYFNQQSRKVISSKFGGKPYGQLRIPICECEHIFNTKMTNAIIKVLSKMIPDDLKAGTAEDRVGFCIVKLKKGKIIQLCLATNYFRWRNSSSSHMFN